MKFQSLLSILSIFFIVVSCGEEAKENSCNKQPTTTSIKTTKTADTTVKEQIEKTDPEVKQDPELENKLKAFVPTGYSIYTFESGYLNSDNITDVVLILKPDGEDSLSSHENPMKRETLILTGKEDGSYVIRKRNFNVTYFYRFDWNFIDCFAELYIGKQNFSISHYGGGEPRWSRSLAFAYNAEEDDWFLVKDTYSQFSVLDLEAEFPEEIKTEKDFGKVRFEEASIY